LSVSKQGKMRDNLLILSHTTHSRDSSISRARNYILMKFK
jgi:hypothetical protein